MSTDKRIATLRKEMAESPSDVTLTALYKYCQRAGVALTAVFQRWDTRGWVGKLHGREILGVLEEQPHYYAMLEMDRCPQAGELYYTLCPWDGKENASSNCWTLNELLSRGGYFIVGKYHQSKLIRFPR